MDDWIIITDKDLFTIFVCENTLDEMLNNKNELCVEIGDGVFCYQKKLTRADEGV